MTESNLEPKDLQAQELLEGNTIGDLEAESKKESIGDAWVRLHYREHCFFTKEYSCPTWGRVSQNLRFFFLNYLYLPWWLCVAALLISPSATVGILFLALVWKIVLRCACNEKCLKASSKSGLWAFPWNN